MWEWMGAKKNPDRKEEGAGKLLKGNGSSHYAAMRCKYGYAPTKHEIIKTHRAGTPF